MDTEFFIGKCRWMIFFSGDTSGAQLHQMFAVAGCYRHDAAATERDGLLFAFRANNLGRLGRLMSIPR